MLRIVSVGLGVAILALAPVAANSATITTLYSTGVDAAGTPQATGSAETHYTVTSAPAGADTSLVVGRSPNPIISPIGPYVADNTLSAWIGAPLFGVFYNLNGNYTYTTTFDLTGFNPGTAAIAGEWAADDGGTEIFINGSPIGAAAANLASFTSFAINSGFVSGVNTLSFLTHNDGDTYSANGFRVQIDSATANLAAAASVPEPASLALLGFGALGLLVARRKFSA